MRGNVLPSKKSYGFGDYTHSSFPKMLCQILYRHETARRMFGVTKCSHQKLIPFYMANRVSSLNGAAEYRPPVRQTDKSIVSKTFSIETKAKPRAARAPSKPNKERALHPARECFFQPYCCNAHNTWKLIAQRVLSSLTTLAKEN